MDNPSAGIRTRLSPNLCRNWRCLAT